MPAKPAPTMTASKCSEVMRETVPEVRGNSASERARPRRVQRRDAGHRAVAVGPCLRGRVEHVELDRVVRNDCGRIARQLRPAFPWYASTAAWPGKSPSGIVSTANTSPACGSSQLIVVTVTTRSPSGISARQSPTLTSVAVTVSLVDGELMVMTSGEGPQHRQHDAGDRHAAAAAVLLGLLHADDAADQRDQDTADDAEDQRRRSPTSSSSVAARSTAGPVRW